MSFLYLAGLDANLIRSASSINVGGTAHSKFGTQYLYDGTPGLPFKYASAGTNSYLSFDLGSAKEVDFVSIHGHNIDSGITAIELRSSTDNFVTVNTVELTLTKATPTFFGRLLSSVTRRYWRLRFVGTNGNPISLGEVCLGKATALAGKVVTANTPFRVTHRRPQSRQMTRSGQIFAEPLSAHRVRPCQFQYVAFSTTQRDAFLAMLAACKDGVEPVVVVPKDTEDFVVLGHFDEEIQETRAGQTYHYAVSIAEMPFEQEYL